VGFVLAAILDFLIVVFAALPFANYRAPVLIAEIAGALISTLTDPLTFQQNVFNATTGDRWRMWNPIAVVRTNFAFVAKSILKN